jgi:hypothetical protein
MIILLAIFFLTKSVLTNQTLELQCVIHSHLHPHEYLYTSNEIWRQLLIKRNIYTYPLYKVNDFKKITWNFTPINNQYDTFLIKNNDDYLCSFNKTIDKNGIRPILNRLSQTGIKMQKKCMWKLEKDDSNKRSYFIWNVEFDQPMYATSFFLQNASFKRIYLWPKQIKHTKKLSDKFIWIINCISGEFLWSN